MAARFNGRSLTKHLNAVAQEAHTIDDAGNPITKEEALARLLWNKALGYEEQSRNEEGTMKTITHKPESWAIQYIYDRKEGRAAPTILEDEGRMKAAEKVRDLAKSRLNALAAVAVGPEKKGPPKHKPKEKK